MIIYISAPYSKGDVVENIRVVIKVADLLLELGHIPFVPHLTHFWHYISPKSWETWMGIDKAFIPRCDAILRLEGESKGADIEVAHAKNLGMPVYYSLEEVPYEI